MPPTTNLRRIAVKLIDPSPFAIRRNRDAYLLEGSFRKLGLQSPVKVRPKHKGRFEIIFGDRRLEEAKKLRIKEIDVIIEDANDTDALLEHVVENCSRKDFNPIEEAEAFRRLKDELHYTTKQVAKLAGKSEGAVSNRLALLKVPRTVQDFVREERLLPVLAQRIAQTIPPKFQEHVAKTIVNNQYEYYQAISYLDALAEQYQLEELRSIATTAQKRDGADQSKVKEILEKRKAMIEEKLKGAFAVDATNIGGLEIWKLAVRVNPKLGPYTEFLFISKEKIIEALRRDLERLMQPKQANLGSDRKLP